MATYSFAYTKDHLDPSEPFPAGQDVYRPLLKLHLSAPSTGNRITLTAVVDSGADHCIFPLAVATALGFNPLTLKKNMTGGVGNAANTTFYAPARLEIPVIAGASLVVDVYAGFCAGVDSLGMGLLGQSGFFDRFTVTLDHRRQTFHITD